MFVTGLAVLTAPIWLPAYIAFQAVTVVAEVAIVSAIVLIIAV